MEYGKLDVYEMSKKRKKKRNLDLYIFGLQDNFYRGTFGMWIEF